jgi:ribose transport system substrate-binding protein
MSTAPTSDAPVKRRTGLLVALVLIVAVAAAVVVILSATGILRSRPRVAIVTAGQTPYWEMVLRGARDSANLHRVSLTTLTPTSDVAAQTESIRSLIGQDYDGVAISVLEPVQQAQALADLGADTPLITYDSDSPVAGRLCFVGTDNYEAGRMAARHIREAIPDGGDVIIAVGSLEKINAQQRRDGLLDELLERTSPRKGAAADTPTKSGKYTIVATLIDDMDPQKATQLAADAIQKNPGVKCFAGLFAYNAPSILQALQQTGKLGQIKVVGFDVNDQTLSGIESGHIAASIMQDPYSMGYTSVRILGDLARGDKRVIPLFQVLHLGCDSVTQENVATVRNNLLTPGHKPTTNPS